MGRDSTDVLNSTLEVFFEDLGAKLMGTDGVCTEALETEVVQEPVLVNEAQTLLD